MASGAAKGIDVALESLDLCAANKRIVDSEKHEKCANDIVLLIRHPVFIDIHNTPDRISYKARTSKYLMKQLSSENLLFYFFPYNLTLQTCWIGCIMCMLIQIPAQQFKSYSKHQNIKVVPCQDHWLFVKDVVVTLFLSSYKYLLKMRII